LGSNSLSEGLVPVANRSAQQSYYAALTQQLAEPFCRFPWEFSGFPKLVRRILKEEDEAFLLDGSYQRPVGFVPDAFAVAPKSRIITILEIVESNDICDRKAAAISECFWNLDAAHWQLGCVLLYPAYAHTMLAWELFALDARAEQFGSYKRAFTSLRKDVATHAEEFLSPAPAEEAHA
jgi:hypothetical protein